MKARRYIQVSSRKQHNSGFKAQVALEAIKNQHTIAEIAIEYGVHPSQVNKLKKKLVTSTEEKRHLVEVDHAEICISRQCELPGLPRSSFYYRPISEYNLLLIDMIDRKYTEHPFYGILRMTVWLHDEGHHVNHKRVQRLMSLMGLRAIYPKPRLSKGRDMCI